MMDLLQIEREESRLIIDARTAIRAGYHPRNEILLLVGDAPVGTVCEVHVPHRTEPLIAAIEEMGLNVAALEVESGLWQLRMVKL